MLSIHRLKSLLNRIFNLHMMIIVNFQLVITYCIIKTKRFFTKPPKFVCLGALPYWYSISFFITLP